ncbi:hypothetical protein [Paracoccus sp. TOH]|uniref:hypothetical protein n=1 Tax=Paracoccus sp. TOH TaxID=1263728 RepID=UPI0025AEDEF1|nr:hypothetical protein [Paracoccus sp. TOH]WJS87206.1 hypothetical protein NBE95_20215 [Paracoccus sp. TOH]
MESGDHFAVQDTEGDTILELPKQLASAPEAASQLLAWLAPVLNQVEHNATLIGKPKLKLADQLRVHAAWANNDMRLGDQEAFERGHQPNFPVIQAPRKNDTIRTMRIAKKG